MIHRIVPFPMTFSDPYRRFQGHRVAIGLDGLNILCVQPTCDLFVIAKLFYYASTAYAAPEASCFALSVATLSVFCLSRLTLCAKYISFVSQKY